jgi:hypothetical protein
MDRFARPRPGRRWLVALALAGCLLGSAAAAQAEAMVLIVANNRSLRSHLPDLQYADDDGIRYYQLWESLLPDARLSLLVQPDAATARANPGFARLPRPPTRANLLIEASALAEAARQARQAGRDTTLYFVFAGHGDVERGHGFLELADGRFDADELQALVSRVGASETHIILDSCNSYFMMAPRKPGGRRLSSGLAAQLAGGAPVLGRLSGVGAFLSTSSEQTVYEWSEIQSGIFSYLVRSGLMGGADADRDGRISYDELRGFVAVAGGRVPNPAVRPNVYARGPDGDGRKVLVDISRSRARALELPPGRRMILRNAEGYRLAELHTEAGFTPRVRLWGGTELQLEMLLPALTPAERPTRLVYALPDRPAVALRELAGRAPADQARGSDRMFQALFEQPFGPEALDRHREEQQAAPPPVYGLSRSDADRLGLHLQLLADTERDARLERALWRGVIAAGLVAFTLEVFTNGESSCGSCRWEKALLGSSAALFTGLTVWNLLPSASENLARDARLAAAAGRDPGLWLPELSHDLDRIGSRAQWGRRLLAGVGGTLLGLVAIGYVSDMIDEGRVTTDNAAGALFWGGVALGTTWLMVQESAEERHIRALKADPLWQSVSIAAAPTDGGFRLALGLRY